MQFSSPWVTIPMSGILFNSLFLLIHFSLFLLKVLLELFYVVVTFLTLIYWVFSVIILIFFTTALVAYVYIFSNWATQDILSSLSYLRLGHFGLFYYSVTFLPPTVTRFWHVAIFIQWFSSLIANNIIWKMRKIYSWMPNTIKL